MARRSRRGPRALAAALLALPAALLALPATLLALAAVLAAEPVLAAAPVVERLSDDRVRIEADDAPRDEVLAALARAARVELVAGLGRPAPARLTLALADAALEDALARVLDGVPYRLAYEADAAGVVALRRVTVGLAPPPAARAAGSARHPRARAGPAVGDAAQGDALAAPAPGADASEDERVAAAAATRPEADLAALVAALADPSPRVRATAAGSLGDVEFGEDAFRATDALLAKLDDPDAGVIAASIEALEAVYDVLPDPRIRAAVERQRRARDPRVRAAADSFLEWTEDAP